VFVLHGLTARLKSCPDTRLCTLQFFSSLLEYADTQALALAHGIGSSAAGTASDQRKAVATLMIPFIFAIGGLSTVWGQSAIDRLQPLVETSARRLVLAREVALAKVPGYECNRLLTSVNCIS